MSREWYQWIDGDRKPWDAGTLPDKRSIFNANFLNQFIGWKNYCLIDSENTPFIAPGDIIQSADFWNSVRYSIDGWWGDSWGAYGYIYEDNPAVDLISAGMKTAGPQYAGVNETYMIQAVKEHHTTPFARSDNLQRLLPEWLMHTRWQLDESKVYASTWGYGNYGAISGRYEIWFYNWRYPPGEYVFEYRSTHDSPYAAIYGNYNYDRVSRIDTLTEANYELSYPVADASLIFEAPSENDVIPGLWDIKANQYYSIGSKKFSGPYPEVKEYQVSSRDFWRVYGSSVMRLNDYLPPEFAPPVY